MRYWIDKDGKEHRENDMPRLDLGHSLRGTCNGCVYKEIKGKPWYSTHPHPCTDCTRRSVPVLSTDNYTPRAADAAGVTE